MDRRTATRLQLAALIGMVGAHIPESLPARRVDEPPAPPPSKPRAEVVITRSAPDTSKMTRQQRRKLERDNAKRSRR